MKRYYAAKAAEFELTGTKIIVANGIEIGVFRVHGEWYAWRNMCPHAAAPVCRGKVCGTRLPSLVYEYEHGMDGQILRCPWHGWEFDLKNGQHLVDEGVKLRGYPVQVEGDDVFVLMPDRVKG